MLDSTPLLRQWTLLRILSARRQGATLRELASEAGVSTKTIQRDLSLLKRLAFPIEPVVSDHGRRHWKLTDAGGVPSLSFTLEEAAALYLGRQFLEGLAGTLFWSAAHSAFRKIQATLGEAAASYLSKLASAVYLTTHSLTDYASRADLIDRLMVAIEDRRLTVITYQSLRSTEPVTFYDVHPYALVHHRGALYVIGWSKDHNSVRVFKVDRICAVEMLQLQFERPEDFDPAKFLAHSFGIFAGDGPPRIVRVRFASPVARILQEKQFHPSQRLTRLADGSAVAEFELTVFEEFTSWVMSFGSQAEVLAPPELREAIALELSAALSRYRTTPRDHPPSPPRRRGR